MSGSSATDTLHPATYPATDERPANRAGADITLRSNVGGAWRPALLLALLMITLLTTGSPAMAQHYSHTYRYSGSIEIDHIPDHDEVLQTLPDNLILRFSGPVTLVKLTLKTADKELVDIRFRYDPIANRVFIWPLPQLPESPYYIVDWGVIDPERKLMQGQFLFAAGPDAVQPSTLVTEEDNEHIMVPDYRLIDPSRYQPVPQ